MSEIVGACRFCGQIGTSDRGFMNQKEADDYATQWCGCDEAQAYREKLEAITTAKENISLLFGDGCEKYSFSLIPSDAVLMLEDLVDAIGSGYISSVSVKLQSGDSAKVSVTAKGAIKVNRSKNIFSTVEC